MKEETIKNAIMKSAFTFGLAVSAANAMATDISPYNYPLFESAINDAKWQRGLNSEKQCTRTGCESTLGSSASQEYIWVKESNGIMHFSTNGDQPSKWRSELRFEDNFSRGSTRTLTARIGYWSNRSTSTGFTIAQLHMETGGAYDVKGPPARLEVIDETHFEVQWRNSYSCTNDCWSANAFSTKTSGMKNVQLKTSGDYINVSVEGQTFSYNLKGSDKNWPSDGGYFWKTGIYLQDEGTAYTGYQSLYW